MVRDDDDADEAGRNASMLQSKSLIANNVLTKRKEQLHRWESSEMNGEPPFRRNTPRVQFQDSDIFLSACMSGDEDEVDDLLRKGADLNTSTVDGLTALHQSVIDSKPDMVQFLCEKGADVNAQDNEGWTPLHAAACCGNLAIVKYLCQNGADLAIINSDKELALDLADDDTCRAFLEQEYGRQGIEPEQCRDQELTTMMRDVQTWIREGHYGDRPHARTGATAMHVSAAKGYTQLLEMLIKAGGNVHSTDKDGWTPLHAAAHWAERDSCKILMEHGASITETNFMGQSVLSVADKDVVEYLEELERASETRKSPSVGATSILAEQNKRVAHVHEDHTISTDQKREMQHRDQSSEKEALQPQAKISRLSEKSPSVDSSASSQEEDVPAPLRQQSRSQSTASEDERVSTAERVPERPENNGRLNYERESETPSSNRSSVERSMSTSSDRTLSSVDHRLSTDRSMSVESSQRSGSGSAMTTTGSTRTSTSSTSSSLLSGDQNVAVTIPRPLQQPNSWINRGVQLVTRSASSSGSRSSATPTSSGSESSASSSQPSTASATSSSAAPAPSLPLTTPPASTATSGNPQLPSSSPQQPLLTKPHFVTSPIPPGSVQRSTSTPSSLPWASLCRGGNIAGDTTASLTASQHSFLSQSRVSAFRPPVKSSAAVSSPVAELPRGLQPQHLSPLKMRPWQSSTFESESERRQTARIQRQNRRSTQGVTKEQLEEAGRIAAEERRRSCAQTAGSTASSVGSSGTIIVRLASEERDSTSMSSSDRADSADRPAAAATGSIRIAAGSSRISQDSDRSGVERCSPPTTSATLSLPSVPSASSTPSAAGLRRKSQGMPLSRSARRGTGPVMAEDVQAAATASTYGSSAHSATTANNATATSSASTVLSRLDSTSSYSTPMTSSYRYTTNTSGACGGGGSTGASNGISSYSRPPMIGPFASRYGSGGSTTSTALSSSDKSHSAPPSHPPPSAPSSAAGLRSAAVAPNRLSSRVAVQPLSSNNTTGSSQSSYATQYAPRPTETNLNYKALYEKEKSESDRLRKENEELRRGQDSGSSVSAFRSVSSRFRNGSSSSIGGVGGGGATLPISKSASGVSLDENEKRALERKIADLEIQMKGFTNLRMENQRLKEENGALVRVISKMTI